MGDNEAAAWEVLDGPLEQVRAELEMLKRLGSVAAGQMLHAIKGMTVAEFLTWKETEDF